MKIYRFTGDKDTVYKFPDDRYVLLKQENDLTTLLLLSPDDSDDNDIPVRIPSGKGLFIEVSEIPTRVFENQYKEDHEWPQSSQS